MRPSRWAMERLRDKAFDWLVVALLGLVAVTFLEPLRDRAIAIWNTPQAMAEIRDQIIGMRSRFDRVERSVTRLQRPLSVFEMSTYNTAPVEGYCVEGEPCRINVRLRRLEAALSCRIVPGSVIWGFINPRADTFTMARRVDQGPGRNIGPTWEDLEIVLMTPYGLEPEADFMFEAYYTNCPGTSDDDDPISYDSPRDRFLIRPAVSSD